MNVKPAIGFLSQDGQAPFTDKVTAIPQWMTNNPAYPSPTPALDVVQTAFNACKVAADAVQSGVQNTLIRDARRAELVSLPAPARQLCERDGQWQPGDAAQQRLSGSKARP